MRDKELLLKYLRQGVDALIEQGCFDNGDDFRETQLEALRAYQKYLNRRDLNLDQKLKGFFEMPTGIGKTAVFVAIVSAAHWAAENDGHELKSAIVVPRNILLEQTQKSFSKFAPEFGDEVGLYGNGFKDLEKPITIMTYNAWSKLSKKRKISANNIDILISDEGHRGTSEGRVQTLTAVFKGVTGQLAFTATAHFDEAKSVQNSHEREIYFKSIPDGIRGGELAAYVSTQFYVIRAQPPKNLQEEFEEEANGETQYRRRLRQAAWNKRAVKIFREGRDEHTGDPLSDNQAAFFVDNINHARNLEKLLNADPVLKKRARQQSRKGVAVAIHSRMSGKEREKQLKAYERGEYMAVIGDDIFKEGFDHQPLKTIIDYQHGSLVDKAQIIGRGARKWYNPEKDREEGLTFIDTITYIGSRDPEADKRLRAEAIRKAVIAHDILEGSYILGSGKKAKKQKRRPPPPPIFADDPDVEEYTKLEDVRLFMGERSRLRKEDLVEITEKFSKELKALFKTAKISPGQLVRNCADLPAGLYENTIVRWINKSAKRALPEHLEYVVNKLEDIIQGKFKPKVSPGRSFDRKGKAKINRVVLTYEMKKKLLSLKEKTGMSGSAILKHAEPNKPKNLKRNTIDALFKDEGAPKTIEKEIYEYIIGLYEKVIKENEERGLNPKKVPIKEEDLAFLQYCREKTGIGPIALISRAKFVPDKMNRGVLNVWFNGQAKTARVDHLEWAKSEWENHLNSLEH